MYGKLPVRRFCLFLASYLYDNTYITCLLYTSDAADE